MLKIGLALYAAVSFTFSNMFQPITNGAALCQRILSL